MNTRIFFIFLMFLLLIVVTACSNNNEPVKYENFSSCLTEKGVKMYGTEWCTHCQNQKKEFGKAFGLVDYIDCDKNQDACLAAGVKGYPTWIIDGKSYSGEQPLERLATLSGCELK